MIVYNQEEIDRISKVKETKDKLEEFFNLKREEWTKNITPLFDALKDNFTLTNSNKIIDVQALSLTYRQMLSEQISFMLNKRSKEEIKLKKLKQDKFIFYATGFGLKTNMGEKSILIDGHISENDRNIQLIENYVDFLRSCSKNLESLGYTIKNIIELMNYLGK